MSLIPKVNMRRTLLIARRDYLGYVKTWGFWISFLTPFVLGVFGVLWASADLDLSPQQNVAVIDQTGLYADGLKDLYEEGLEESARAAMSTRSFFIQDRDKRAEFDRVLQTEGAKAAQEYLKQNVRDISPDFEAPEAKFNLVSPPATTLEGIMPYLKGEKLLSVDGESAELGGVIIFKAGPDQGQPDVEYWSTNINKRDAPFLVNRYLRRLARITYLGSEGLSVSELNRRVAIAPKAKLFNPVKTAEEDQGVNSSDIVPFFVASVMALMLWLTVFSGAYMLLTSMLEEKLNKLLEMMLASTRFAEIILGKLLGVAALTLSMMTPYILVGVAGVLWYIFLGPADKDVVSGLVSAFDARMIIFLIIYLVLGYLLYGAFFIALGALSSSMQDAQTLTTPILFILMACVAIIPLGISAPDSPLLRIATFIPFSAPFAAIVRLPADPPLWELLLSTAFLALLCIGTIAMAGRIFKFGVLSGAGAGVVISWFKRVILRRKA